MNPLRRRTSLAAPLLGVILALTACASSAPTPDVASAGQGEDSHDVGAGDAAEVASPALALVVADAEGTVTLLDLETEERTVLAEARADVESIDGDGRLIYIAQREGDRTAVDVVDSGRWTVPHGDHTHSFVGTAGSVGTIKGEGAAHVTTGGQASTLQFDGESVVIAHEDLSSLADSPRRELAAAGPVVPFAAHLLVPGSDGMIDVLDASGTVIPGRGMPCTDAADADITRVGAVFSCAEGAVLFTREVGGAIAGESIPYPSGVSAAIRLEGRADRPDLAGVADDRGAWLLDVRQRTWTPLPSEVPLLRAVAVGDDDGRTIALDTDGRVRVLAPDGTVLARTDPLLAASLADPAFLDRVQLIADAQHAYLSDPAAGAIHEIDHRDGATLTRTFTDLDPGFVQQVG